MKTIFSLIFLLLLNYLAISQLIKPCIFNSGGGAYAGNNSAEWSIGESISISTFSSAGLIVNTGVIQPNINVVTAITEIGSIVFGNQITISPNPSYGKINMVLNMQKPGKAMVSIFNSASKLIKKIELREIDLLQTKTLVLDELPAGVYFFNVLFQPNAGVAKNWVYKIIRL